MRKTITGLMVAIVGAGVFFFEKGATPMASEAAENEPAPKIAHNVYFTLKDSSEEAQKKLVEACKKYLSDHPGTLFFCAGTVAEFDRPVNDRDWHVGLHVFFKDAEAHDKYQVAEKHLKFIEENKENWAKVRVFDTVYK